MDYTLYTDKQLKKLLNSNIPVSDKETISNILNEREEQNIKLVIVEEPIVEPEPEPVPEPTPIEEPVIVAPTIDESLIDIFDVNEKSNRTKMCKVIGHILKEEVPQTYYDNNAKWSSLKDKVEKFFHSLTSLVYTSKEIVVKSSGNYEVSFKNDIGEVYESYKVEFYNSPEYTIKEEFLNILSRKRQSQYKGTNIGDYADFFYDNHIDNFRALYGINKPSREVYLENINKTKPSPLTFTSKIAKFEIRNPEKSVKRNELLDASVKDYMNRVKTSMNLEQLTEDLAKVTQKVYMVFNNNQFHIDRISREEILPNKTLVRISKENYLIFMTRKKKTSIVMKLIWKQNNEVIQPYWYIDLIRH
jgi:hypothetical protein